MKLNLYWDNDENSISNQIFENNNQKYENFGEKIKVGGLSYQISSLNF